MKWPAKERGRLPLYESNPKRPGFCENPHKAGGANKTNLSVAYAIILAIKQTKGKNAKHR